MAAEFLLCLSRDLLKLFETSNAFDVSIRVGEGPNTKTFNAHSSILIARSPYFATKLSSEWVRRENGVIKFAKPSITPRVFEIVLKYLYGGEIALGQYGIPGILEILIAADELCLQHLIEYAQTHLIENHAQSLKQSFALIYQTVFKFESFRKLQEYCTSLAANNPEMVFRSADFTSLKATVLLSLIQRDNLSMNEIEVWDCVLKWGIAQTKSLPETVSDWSAEDFQNLQLTLQDLLPFIRFYHISSVDFYHKVKPYAQILPGNLYEDLLQHYLVPGSHDADIRDTPQRSNLNSNSDLRPSSTISSSIINQKQLSQIDKWISGDSHETFDNQKYRLLLRGSRDGFTPRDFHRLCDHKGATVTIIRVKGTGQIIGGYNPLSWDSNSGRQTDSRSFIFSLGTRNSEKIVYSKYRKGDSVYNISSHGPIFGYLDRGIWIDYDLFMGKDFQSEKSCYSRRSSYENSIVKGAESAKAYFSIEDYEVFQVLDM